MRDRRIGIFKIPFDAINDRPDEVRRILAGVIVVRAEAMFVGNEVSYVGICDQFEAVEPGASWPQYTAVVEGKAMSWRKLS